MISAQNYRPLFTLPDVKWHRRINWKWLLQRSPMVALAILSSWGVGGFIGQSGKAPMPVPIIGGAAFDLVFLGVIALADQQLRRTTQSHVLYWVLNVGAAGIAALLNTLYYSGGTYAGVTPESITHGVPFAIFGLLYSLYYHGVMSEAIDKELNEQDKERVKCANCGRGFPSEAALNGHRRSCKETV